MNNLIHVIVALIVFGVLLYIVMQLPMPVWVKNVINAIAALAVLLWVLSALGIYIAPFRLR